MHAHRGQAKSPFSQKFYQHTTAGDYDHGAVLRIIFHTNRHFNACRYLRHEQHPLAEALLQVAISPLQMLQVWYSHYDPVFIGLM